MPGDLVCHVLNRANGRQPLFDNATADQIITDPRYPGLQITLPAGVTITGWDGVVKTQIALERVDPDRLPVPPPSGAESFYQIFFGIFGTPMGGVPSAPLPVASPNDLDLDPGEQAELWYYNASPMGGPAGWTLAGTGTVSEDGSQIVSDPGVGIERFCGVCGLLCFIPTTHPVHLGSGARVDTSATIRRAKWLRYGSCVSSIL